MWREFSCGGGVGVFDVYPFQKKKKKGKAKKSLAVLLGCIFCTMARETNVRRLILAIKHILSPPTAYSKSDHMLPAASYTIIEFRYGRNLLD